MRHRTEPVTVPLRESAKIRVLLVSRDLQTIETICRSTDDLAIHVEPCSELDAAARKLCRAKYEGVIVDLTPSQNVIELLRRVRESTSHRNAISIAISDHKDQRVVAFEAGAHFVLERPLIEAELGRTLRAAYPLMMRERRRYFRCPVQIPVQVKVGSGVEFAANTINISESGIAIVSSIALSVGERLELRIRLPGRSEVLTLVAEVCWTQASGRTGIQFPQLSRHGEEVLQTWLSDRLQEPVLSGESDRPFEGGA